MAVGNEGRAGERQARRKKGRGDGVRGGRGGASRWGLWWRWLWWKWKRWFRAMPKGRCGHREKNGQKVAARPKQRLKRKQKPGDEARQAFLGNAQMCWEGEGGRSMTFEAVEKFWKRVQHFAPNDRECRITALSVGRRLFARGGTLDRLTRGKKNRVRVHHHSPTPFSQSFPLFYSCHHSDPPPHHTLHNSEVAESLPA